MTNDYRKFLEKYGYKATLSYQKFRVQVYLKKYNEEKAILENLQKDYISIYKAKIVRSYLTKWQASGKFPKDDELTNAIFTLGNLELPKELLTGAKPKISFKFYNDRVELTYYNERLSKWIELK